MQKLTAQIVNELGSIPDDPVALHTGVRFARWGYVTHNPALFQCVLCDAIMAWNARGIHAHALTCPWARARKIVLGIAP